MVFWIFSKLAATQRAKRRLWTNQEMVYGPYTTNHTMMFLFGLVFCAIMPLIAPVCLCYFIVVFVLEKYNRVYVLTHGYEAAGKMWPLIFGQVRGVVCYVPWLHRSACVAAPHCYCSGGLLRQESRDPCSSMLSLL